MTRIKIENGMSTRTRYNVSDLTAKPLPQQRESLRALVGGARAAPNGEIAELDQRILAFEKQHGIDSATMLARVRTGELRETWDICDWLLTLDLRDSIVARRPSRSG